jgi:hypothetical protein
MVYFFSKTIIHVHLNNKKIIKKIRQSILRERIQMIKEDFLHDIAKGSRKVDNTFGGLSFFTIDDMPYALDTNRYMSG